MGKKKSGRSTGAGDHAVAAAGTAFLLRVPMHCRCQGCSDKIRAGVRDLTLNHSYGVQALDQSELGTKGELKVLATGDPDRLRRRLHKSTGKNVDLQLLGSNKQQQNQKDAGLQQQQQHPPAAAQYAHQALPAYAAYGAAAPQQAASYSPWALDMLLQQQQQAAAAYPYLHGAAYAYAYPQQGLGAYGGGVWPGHGGGY